MNTFFKSILVFVLFIISGEIGYAQKKCIVSGYIRDNTSGEDLAYASIYIYKLKSGTSSNEYGFYSLSLNPGIYELKVSHLGYNSDTFYVDLNKNIKLNIELVPSSKILNEVTVIGKEMNENVTKNEMSSAKLSMKEISSIPVLFGEKDVLKTIQLLPGVASGTEGTSGFYVRGGSVDQNLVLMDEAPVYNASHLVGFFSVFNSDALKDVKLIKSGIPAQYGGRLSSVLDIQMNNGNMKSYNVSGGIGLISSRITVEGPIIKDKASFIVTGRRTYGDVAFKFANQKRLQNSRVYFYDFNLKANFKLSEKDRIFLSGYYGRDALKYANDFGFDWGNATNTLRWNHLFSDKLFSNLSFIFSQYNYYIHIYLDNDMMHLQSGINNLNIKDDFTYYPNTKNTIKAGFNLIYYWFKPGEITYDKTGTTDLVIDKKYALEGAAYISDEEKITSFLNLEYGLRYSNFYTLGPGDEYMFNGFDPVDTIHYKKGEIIKFYQNLEPRFLINFIIDPVTSVKASYSRTAQYVHLMSNSTATIPTDLWIPSSTIVKPQKANQYAVGLFRNFDMNKYETSVELYYKDLINQIDYKNGASTLFNKYIEGGLVFGTGRAYGIELYVKKNVGKLTGWVKYTLSKTERKFKEINRGNYFPSKFDRTHDVAIVAMYKITGRLTASATWVYYTGDAVTFPGGKYLMFNMPVFLYSNRNDHRMPDYHRLDLGVSLEGKKHERYSSVVNFSIYNVYARENPFMMSFRQIKDKPGQFEAVQISIFTIVPSVSWDFKF